MLLKLPQSGSQRVRNDTFVGIRLVPSYNSEIWGKCKIRNVSNIQNTGQELSQEPLKNVTKRNSWFGLYLSHSVKLDPQKYCATVLLKRLSHQIRFAWKCHSTLSFGSSILSI
jgi:hypothetical protein